jgi:uroporphyrinogen decarboxylase
MNERQRFLATMRYQPRDRAPICDFSFWKETLVVWREQGLPADVTRENADDFFGMDRLLLSNTGASVDLCPLFEEKIIEDRGDHEVAQQTDGVRVLRKKFLGSIPQHLGHLLVDRDSWERHYKPRLDPDHPDRYPADWNRRVKDWTDPDRDYPVSLPGGSLYGKLRDWMGVQNLSLLIYDDPLLFDEMVTTLADCIIGVLTRLLDTGGRFDACGIWEDMAYRAGPLLSPRHFKKYLAPHYRRIVDLLRRYEVDIIYVDCDGNVDALIPLWLDAGISCVFPVEVGTWNADPIRYRQQYGRDLLMMGGFDKHILSRSPADIDAEVDRLAPLIEEGGFIGFCDHRVPPDVPLANYVHYLQTIRRVWGKDTNLKPMMVAG